MARRNEFEGRVLAILDPALKRGGRPARKSAALLAGLAALFVAVAASAPSRASARSAFVDRGRRPTRPRRRCAPRRPAPRPGRRAAPWPQPQRTPSRARGRRRTQTADGGTPARASDDDDQATTSRSEIDGGPAGRARPRRCGPTPTRPCAAPPPGRSPRAGKPTRPRRSAPRCAATPSAEVREMAAWALGAGARSESGAALADALRADSERRGARHRGLGARPAPRCRRRRARGRRLGRLRRRCARSAIWGLGNQGDRQGARRRRRGAPRLRTSASGSSRRGRSARSTTPPAVARAPGRVQGGEGRRGPPGALPRALPRRRALARGGRAGVRVEGRRSCARSRCRCSRADGFGPVALAVAAPGAPALPLRPAPQRPRIRSLDGPFAWSVDAEKSASRQLRPEEAMTLRPIAPAC